MLRRSLQADKRFLVEAKGVYSRASSMTLDLSPRVFWVIALSMCYSESLLPEFGYLAYVYTPLVLVTLTGGRYTNVPAFMTPRNFRLLRLLCIPIILTAGLILFWVYSVGNFVMLFLYCLWHSTLLNSSIFSLVRIDSARNWDSVFVFVHVQMIVSSVSIFIFDVELACVIFSVFSYLNFFLSLKGKADLPDANVTKNYFFNLAVSFYILFAFRHLEKPLLLFYDSSLYSFYMLVFIYLGHLVSIVSQVMTYLFASSYSKFSDDRNKMFSIWEKVYSAKREMLFALLLSTLSVAAVYRLVTDESLLVLLSVLFSSFSLLTFALLVPMLERFDQGVRLKIKGALISGMISFPLVAIALFSKVPPYFFSIVFYSVFCSFIILNTNLNSMSKRDEE